MKLIVITPPQNREDELELIRFFIQNKVYKVHIRKDSAEDAESLLFGLNTNQKKYISIHGFEDLALKHGVAFHAKSHQASLTAQSKSFHEVSSEMETYLYSFLSPFFNSISKKGYQANTDLVKIKKLPKGVFALGGITVENLPLLSETPIEGVAILGSIWNSKQPKEAYLKYINATNTDKLN